jgi:hypothetical protein
LEENAAISGNGSRSAVRRIDTVEMHWAEELTIDELALARLCEFAQEGLDIQLKEGLDDTPIPLT